MASKENMYCGTIRGRSRSTALCLSWFLLLTSLNIVSIFATEQKIMACYLVGGKFENFSVDAVDPFLCTHILYPDGIVTPGRIETKRPIDMEQIKLSASLKKKNPDLKIIVSLSHGFSSVVGHSKEKVMRFCSQALKFLQNYTLDGFDLDWEFPKSHDKNNFITFIQILSHYLRPHKLLLTMAIPHRPDRIEEGFDIATLNKYVDFITVMTYGFFGGRGKVTDYISPLYTPKGEKTYESTAESLSYLLSKGLSKDKMLMGIPMFGRSWILENPKEHWLHSLVKGAAGPSPYSAIPGMYIHADVCVASKEGATLVYDPVNVGAFLYHGSIWACFEGKQALTKKMEWLKSHDLAGVGIWAYQYDDFRNVCGLGALPLLNFIHDSLNISLHFSSEHYQFSNI